MACYHDPIMVRFLPEFTTFNEAPGLKVVFWPTDSNDKARTKSTTFSLEPEVSSLNETKIAMHGSPTTGYDMGEEYNKWFSDCIGKNVELVYVGQNWRQVLGNLSPNAGSMGGSGSGSWAQSISSAISSVPILGSLTAGDHEQGLGLSDVAAVLLVSKTSLQHITRLLPKGSEGDITKFRPNIVIGGAEEEYAEDFWREIEINGNKVLLTQNCNRCVSLNLDYNTGDFATGEVGKVLANLSRDRRVDPGAKYSPVFGRYGFLEESAHSKKISVGNKVLVTATIKERDQFCKLRSNIRRCVLLPLANRTCRLALQGSFLVSGCRCRGREMSCERSLTMVIVLLSRHKCVASLSYRIFRTAQLPVAARTIRRFRSYQDRRLRSSVLLSGASESQSLQLLSSFSRTAGSRIAAAASSRGLLDLWPMRRSVSRREQPARHTRLSHRDSEAARRIHSLH